uniref:SAM domain-containing protein n=1 Tax=Sinocyclocheilus anshuiensis TaxID=1608454 RepID=A0A671P0Q3_9TELE
CLTLKAKMQITITNKLSKAADMDHHWVSKTWLSDVGLPQYSQVFHNQLVDGRVLNSITRRDLETIFNVTNKFHVTSILSAIQLLQMLNFDKEARRAQCENRDLDPVVWTSHRVIKWIRDIDLKEYADSLQNSGIHGAVMVLDPTFSADTMAKALDIPSNKHMIHRHLYEEMKVLLNPARCVKLHFSRVISILYNLRGTSKCSILIGQ